MQKTLVLSRCFEKTMPSRKRHIAKTITLRIIATGTTFLLTLFFFRDDPNATEKATWVAVAEASLKMIFYYYHERIWFKIKVGVRSAVRHLMKTVTWRIIASVTTFLVALFFFRENPTAMEKATWVAVVETFIKMLFYYIHERAWHKSKFGLE